MGTDEIRERRCEDCRQAIDSPGPATRFCRSCRALRRRKRKKYDWTTERDQILRDRYNGSIQGRAQEIADQIGFPCWAVKKRAAALGLTNPSTKGPDWTDKEVAFLKRHVGRHRIEWIARRMPGRSLSAVILKCKRLRLSRRYQPGLTMLQTESMIGVDHREIARWVKDGRLPARRRTVGEIPKKKIERNGYRNAWFIREEDLLQFILENPEEIPLHRVEPESFLELVTRPARELLEIRGTCLRGGGQ